MLKEPTKEVKGQDNLSLTVEILRLYEEGYFFPGLDGIVPQMPHDIARQFRENCLLGMRELLKTKDARVVLKDALNTLARERMEQNEYLRNLLALVVDQSRIHERWFFEYAIEKAKQRLEYIENETKRFERLLKISRERPESKAAIERVAKEKYSREQLEEIKFLVKPDMFLGKPVRKIGKRSTFLCPLHSEKTPSFTWFDTEKPHFKCFGCQAKGSIIDLYMLVNGMDFPHAVSELKQYI